MTSSTQTWRELFLNWPAGLPRRGLVVSNLNEGMPFKSFLTRGEMLMLERTNPDAMGGTVYLDRLRRHPHGEIHRSVQGIGRQRRRLHRQTGDGVKEVE